MTSCKQSISLDMVPQDTVNWYSRQYNKDKKSKTSRDNNTPSLLIPRTSIAIRIRRCRWFRSRGLGGSRAIAVQIIRRAVPPRRHAGTRSWDLPWCFGRGVGRMLYSRRWSWLGLGGVVYGWRGTFRVVGVPFAFAEARRAFF